MKLHNKTLTKIIVRSLRDCIKAHGPITTIFIDSATKRIRNSIEGTLGEFYKQDVQKEIGEKFVIVEKKDWERKCSQIGKFRKSIMYWKNKAENPSE